MVHPTENTQSRLKPVKSHKTPYTRQRNMEFVSQGNSKSNSPVSRFAEFLEWSALPSETRYSGERSSYHINKIYGEIFKDSGKQLKRVVVKRITAGYRCIWILSKSLLLKKVNEDLTCFLQHKLTKCSRCGRWWSFTFTKGLWSLPVIMSLIDCENFWGGTPRQRCSGQLCLGV